MNVRITVEFERELPPGWQLKPFEGAMRLYHQKHSYVRPGMYFLRAPALGKEDTDEVYDPLCEQIDETLFNTEPEWSVEELS